MNQTTYYAHEDGPDVCAPVQRLDAATLDAAMREADDLFGAGYRHHDIRIWQDGHEVASRPMVGRWSTHE